MKPSPVRLSRLAKGAAGVLYAGALIAAPAIPAVLPKVAAVEPKRTAEVSREAMRMWTEVTPLPLRIAAGSEIYAQGLAFYSGQDTSVFLNFDPRLSPWVAPASLDVTGFLAVCEDADEACQKRASELGITVQGHILLAVKPLKPVSLRIFIRPPKA